MHRSCDSDLQEMSRKTVHLMEELLLLFAGLSQRLRGDTAAVAGDGRRSASTLPAASEGGEFGLRPELEGLRRRLDALETYVYGEPSLDGEAEDTDGHSVARPDRAASKVSPARDRAKPSEPAAPPARLAREASRALALDAARALRRKGKTITLAAVAREAGLKYSQVVYAFRRRRDLLEQVNAEGGSEG